MRQRRSASVSLLRTCTSAVRGAVRCGAGSRCAGVNDFPAYGYDYTFSTYMATPQGQEVDTYTSTAAPTVANPGAAASTAVPVGAIVGAIGGFCVLAVVVVVVVVKRRKQRRAADTPSDWLSVKEATAELKSRFGFGEVNGMFSEDRAETSANHYRRNLESINSILAADPKEQLQYDDHPSQVALARVDGGEGDVMDEKQFVWDSQAGAMILVRKSAAPASPVRAAPDIEAATGSPK